MGDVRVVLSPPFFRLVEKSVFVLVCSVSKSSFKQCNLYFTASNRRRADALSWICLAKRYLVLCCSIVLHICLHVGYLQIIVFFCLLNVVVHNSVFLARSDKNTVHVHTWWNKSLCQEKYYVTFVVWYKLKQIAPIFALIPPKCETATAKVEGQKQANK